MAADTVNFASEAGSSVFTAGMGATKGAIKVTSEITGAATTKVRAGASKSVDGVVSAAARAGSSTASGVKWIKGKSVAASEKTGLNSTAKAAWKIADEKVLKSRAGRAIGDASGKLIQRVESNRVVDRAKTMTSNLAAKAPFVKRNGK